MAFKRGHIAYDTSYYHRRILWHESPTLNLSDSTLSSGLVSYSDSQIVANITVPANTPNEDVSVSVTNNGYGGSAFYGGSSGASPMSGPANATVQTPSNTPEVTIIGWVDGNASDIVAAVNAGPSTAALQSSLNGGFVSCSALLYQWYEGVSTDLSTTQDGTYANAWLLQNSVNPPPPASTINPTSELQGGAWRLFNDFGAGKGTFAVGTTPFPCIGGTPTWFDPAGQPSPYLGSSGQTSAGNTYQLSEGRLGSMGRQINATINSNVNGTPWIWSVIEFNASGNPSWPYLSMFPTFDIYINGAWVAEIPQGSAQTFIGQGQAYQLTPSQIQ